MTAAEAWERLGIEPTTDVAAIKRAYATRLRALDRQADPEGFQALTQAFKLVLAEAQPAKDAPTADWQDSAATGEAASRPNSRESLSWEVLAATAGAADWAHLEDQAQAATAATGDAALLADWLAQDRYYDDLAGWQQFVAAIPTLDAELTQQRVVADWLIETKGALLAADVLSWLVDWLKDGLVAEDGTRDQLQEVQAAARPFDFSLWRKLPLGQRESWFTRRRAVFELIDTRAVTWAEASAQLAELAAIVEDPTGVNAMLTACHLVETTHPAARRAWATRVAQDPEAGDWLHAVAAAILRPVWHRLPKQLLQPPTLPVALQRQCAAIATPDWLALPTWVEWAVVLLVALSVVAYFVTVFRHQPLPFYHF